MTKKTICTTLDQDLWKQAAFKDIKWVDALEVGVKVLLGAVGKDETDIIKLIDEKSNELDYLKEKLTKMRKDAKENAEKILEEQKKRVIKRWE